ncbi:MAG: hypothetical protein HY059_03665 [Proteobacteria bacterium]|nr:hypothetical protein [Pseudomonadota bacterium]
MQAVLKVTRQAMFGLGVAAFVGIVGQAAAIYFAGPGSSGTTATPIVRAQLREPGARTPQHSGFADAARRFEAVYGRDGDEGEAVR